MMKNRMKEKVISQAQFSKKLMLGYLVAFCLLLASGCVSSSETATQPLPLQEQKKSIDFNKILLPSPADSKDLDYFGLPENKSFYLSQIQADIVLINVFSTTCPHCQKEAPNTNKLYETIESRPDLRSHIKILGLGARDTREKIAMFKEAYNVPFPLLPDTDMALFNELQATATPTMMGIKMSEGKDPQFLFSKTGTIGDVDWFIDFILDTAGLKKL